MYGRYTSASQDGFSTALDGCGGHTHGTYAYHYHSFVRASTTTAAADNGAGLSYNQVRGQAREAVRAWVPRMDRIVFVPCPRCLSSYLPTGLFFCFPFPFRNLPRLLVQQLPSPVLGGQHLSDRQLLGVGASELRQQQEPDCLHAIFPHGLHADPALLLLHQLHRRQRNHPEPGRVSGVVLILQLFHLQQLQRRVRLERGHLELQHGEQSLLHVLRHGHPCGSVPHRLRVRERGTRQGGITTVCQPDLSSPPSCLTPSVCVIILLDPPPPRQFIFNTTANATLEVTIGTYSTSYCTAGVIQVGLRRRRTRASRKRGGRFRGRRKDPIPFHVPPDPGSLFPFSSLATSQCWLYASFGKVGGSCGGDRFYEDGVVGSDLAVPITGAGLQRVSSFAHLGSIGRL